MTRGGARPGAGRKKGSGQYGEETKVLRVPVSSVGRIKNILLADFSKKVKSCPPSVGTVYDPTVDMELAVPLYESRVAAGLPSPAGDYEEERLDLNKHLLKNPQSTFFVRVSGDSMVDAGIHPGDLLVVDRTLRPANGRIVIAVVNGELTVKKMFKEGDELFLMPENTAYAAIEVTTEMDFMVWGVVTNVIHDLM